MGSLPIINLCLLPPGGGSRICKTAQRYCSVDPLMRKQDFALRLLLTVASLPSPSLPNYQFLDSAPWNSGKDMEAEGKLFSVIKEMGDIGFVPRAPTGSPAWYHNCFCINIMSSSDWKSFRAVSGLILFISSSHNTSHIVGVQCVTLG